MLNSFRFQLAALLVALVLLPTSVVGYISYRSSLALLRRHTIKEVGMVANFKKDSLLLRLHLQRKRAQEFLSTLEIRCGRGSALDVACARPLLVSFMKVEDIVDAELRVGNGPPFRIGPGTETLASHPPLREGQIAQFSRWANGEPHYLMEAEGERPGSRLLLLYGMRVVEASFADSPELGKSGEAFLADNEGFFLTRPKYHSHSGISHPIDALPMKHCLSGQNGEMLAIDYRRVPVIHGYRYLPEIGGGCIMAHIQQDEAFEPLSRLSSRLVKAAALLTAIALALGSLVSHFFSKVFTNPLQRLVDRVLKAKAGDLSSPVPVEGPAEFRILGRGFARMVETQRKNLEARDDFVSIVSHDLKNPVHALGIRVAMLERKAKEVGGETGDAFLRQITQMQLTLHRMQELIHSLLDLTTIQSGQFHVVRSRQDCRSILAESAELFLPLLDRKKIRLKLEEPTIAVPAELDRGRILQVLGNLLGNALRFTPEGGEIRLELVPEPASANQPESLRFGVQDSGPGIPPEQQALIFDRYYQGKNAGSGCGLGLFIAKEIVTAHGGTIWVDSGVKRGALVCFRIPVKQPSLTYANNEGAHGD